MGDARYRRPGPIMGGQNPSGDMVEGGNFESWFYLQPPGNDSDNNKKNLFNVTCYYRHSCRIFPE